MKRTFENSKEPFLL